MPPPPARPADPASANLGTALSCWRGRWEFAAAAILRGGFSFWIGSGISRAVFPNLQELLTQLLNRLQREADWTVPACPYADALRRIVGMTTVDGIEPSRPVDEWPLEPKSSLLRQLVDRYSAVLEEQVRFPNESLSVAYDLLELPRIYADDRKVPDAEHRFLALLVAEGIAKEIVTTNWDALVERACAEICEAADPLKVVVRAEDLAGGEGALGGRLTKVHGCAVRTVRDPAVYRQYMVATDTEIQAWVHAASTQAVREYVRAVLWERAALFVGLSGQDWNLQLQALDVASTREPFPADQPRVLFSVRQVEPPQRRVLARLHGSGYIGAAADELDRLAAIPLYGKPLLGSLYVETVLQKARLLMRLSENEFRPGLFAFTLRFLGRLEDTLLQRYDGDDARWPRIARELPAAITRLLSMFRKQALPARPGVYEPISKENLADMENAIDLRSAGYQWLLFGLALLQDGEERGYWMLSPPGDPGTEGQFSISDSRGALRAFLINAQRSSLARLGERNYVDLTAPEGVIVIHPQGRRPHYSVRTPTRTLPGSESDRQLGQVWLWELEDEFRDDVEAILEALRLEILGVEAR